MLNCLTDEKKFLGTYINKKLGIRSMEKYSYWFPLPPLPILARMVGDIMSDGHLRKKAIHFIAKDKREVLKFRESVSNLFSVKGVIRRTPANKDIWECLVMNGPLCRVLNLCGVPFGDKTLSEFLVPDWIINGSDSVQSAFLQGIYDGDGSVFLKEGRRLCISLHFHKADYLDSNMKQFFEQIRFMFLRFGIKSTNISVTEGNKRKDGIRTLSYHIWVYGTRRNLISPINFQKHVGFSIDRKSKKLSKLIKLLSKPSKEPS